MYQERRKSPQPSFLKAFGSNLVCITEPGVQKVMVWGPVDEFIEVDYLPAMDEFLKYVILLVFADAEEKSGNSGYCISASTVWGQEIHRSMQVLNKAGIKLPENGIIEDIRKHVAWRGKHAGIQRNLVRQDSKIMHSLGGDGHSYRFQSFRSMYQSFSFPKDYGSYNRNHRLAVKWRGEI
jgi:hypothetical protein